MPAMDCTIKADILRRAAQFTRVGLFLASTLGRRERETTVAVSNMADPTAKGPKKREKVVQSERSLVSSGTLRSVRQRAKTEINFVGPLTLPFHARRSGLAELIVLYEGTILAVVYDDVETGKVPVRFTWTWDRLVGSSYPMHPVVSSRVSFSARPQALRRHRCRLLRQRLDFFTPSQTLSFLASCLSTGPQE